MEDWREKVKYEAANPEECRRLESGMEMLLQNVTIEGGHLIISPGFIPDKEKTDLNLSVYPQKTNSIKAVRLKGEDVRVITATPEDIFLTIGRNVYHIHYNPSEI